MDTLGKQAPQPPCLYQQRDLQRMNEDGSYGKLEVRSPNGWRIPMTTLANWPLYHAKEAWFPHIKPPPWYIEA